MDLQHINIKIFVDGELPVSWEKFIEVFHSWTATPSLPELLIDVADYRHVPDGPGVILVGHEADYGMDNTDGRPGLKYNCKVRRDGSNADRIQQAFDAVVAACLRLEQEVPGLKFRRDGFELTVNDRGLTPNTAENRQAAEGMLAGLLQETVGQLPTLDFQTDERQLFGASVVFAEPLELAGA